MDKKEPLGLLNINTSIYNTRLSNKFIHRKKYKPVDPKNILSFIPGTVFDIYVQTGDSVTKGQELMILDAMKMKNKLKSNIDGKVKSIEVKKGDRVSKGDLLIVLG